MGNTSTCPINFEQTAPAETWAINHKLGYRPSVQAFVMHNGQEVAILPKNIVYVDEFTVHIEFSSARSGRARLV